MPNKRSKRKNIQHFFCPHCGLRMWRLKGVKNYIFYENAKEIRDNTGITYKKASFLATQNTTYLDRNKWIEDFCCGIHGKVWLLISYRENQLVDYRLAKEKDWLKTHKTRDPRRPNPSVSDFTYRMSRKSYY